MMVMVDPNNFLFDYPSENIDNGKKKYEQKYRKAWEKEVIFQGWLSGVPGEPMLACCKVCKTTLRARKKDLEDHQKSRKHGKHLAKKIRDMNDFYLVNSPKQEHDICDEEQQEDIGLTYSISNNIFETKPSLEPPKDIFSESPATPVKPYSIEIVNVDEEEKEKEKECSTNCCQNDDFSQFGKYVGNELRSVGDHMAVQRAKLEINRILYSVTVGEFDTPASQTEPAFIEVAADENAFTEAAKKLAELGENAQIQFI